MHHEKIFVRDDGSKAKIRVSVWLDWSVQEPNYKYEVLICEPRKRTWREVYNFDSDYSWRRMNKTDRMEFQKQQYLKYVTAKEIEQTLLELWEMLKPKTRITELQINGERK